MKKETAVEKAKALEEIAEFSETIPYELLCGVHKRLRFIERN